MRSDKRRVAKVAVDLPSIDVDKEFDYFIPERLEGSVSIGSSVVVPFAGALRLGYVVGFADDTEIERVLEIEGSVDGAPVISGEELELCRWIAERYMSSVASAIRLVLPPGRVRKVSYELHANPKGDRSLTPRQREIAAFVKNEGPVGIKELKRRFGEAAVNHVAELVRARAVGKRYFVEKPLVREKLERCIKATEAGLAADGELGKAPKQKALMEVLSGREPVPVREALLRSGASSYQVRSLVERGFAEISQRRVERIPREYLEAGNGVFTLTSEQMKAAERVIDSATKNKHEVFLLQGITGSGKTEVYFEVISAVLSEGKGAVVLVPEIALTSQMVARFKARFGQEVAVAHSGLSDGERFDQWESVRSGRARVVVGARSAVFYPVSRLGAVIVDEEHEAAYKQTNAPRYNARDVAIEVARRARVPAILGSATPSLESRFKAESGLFGHIKLTERPCGRPLPSIELVDMREEPRVGKMKPLVGSLLKMRIGEALEAGGKAMLLLNKRGFSNYLLCPDCGYVPVCGSCAVSLNFHSVGRRLKCHHCGYSVSAPRICPKCSSHRLFYKGAGTQRAELELAALFPDIRLIRMDADTTRGKDAHQALLKTFQKEARAILLGTQMIAKGLDFPDVLLVGVLDADTALYLPDFRSFERTFQLLMQVAGRAGRGDSPGKVVLQTFSPDNPAIQAVVGSDFETFFREELKSRDALGYPPVNSIARILFSGESAEETEAVAETSAKALDGCPGTLLGPSPAPLVRVKGEYRYHILVKTSQPEELRAFIRERLGASLGRRGRVASNVDIDPVWVL
ncbi:MAG: replication restart helicase PriA [Candidatus Aquicultorales bacterium]